MNHLPSILPRRFHVALGDRQGFGAYHDLYASGSTVSRVAGPFSATVVGHRLPHLLLVDRQITGAAHRRDAARVRADGFDHFVLQILRAGRLAAGSPGDERAMGPGDAVLFDTTRPHATVAEGADYITVSVPRDRLEAMLPEAGSLHGLILPRAVSGLLGDFVGSLVRHAAHLGPEVAVRSGAMVAEMLAAAARVATPPRDAQEDALALHLFRGQAFIEAHIHDPGLDAGRVAAGLGLSRSALYRAFGPVDGVARQISLRRLKALRAALRTPSERRSVAALCYDLGFSSESQGNRAFKAAFGAAPGRFRAEARAAAALAASRISAFGYLGLWRSELH